MADTMKGERTTSQTRPVERIWPYAILGVALGIVFTRGEVISWFRIQEMFRFQSFHMYGIIGSAIAVGALSIALLKRLDARTVRGDAIEFPDSAQAKPRTNHIVGGIVFGLGWGLVGACPGPLFALAGSGLPVMLVALIASIAGAWT